MTRVLVVDDIEDILYAVKVGLESLEKGYEVFQALSAEEGLKLIPQVMPDIIVMDVMMPGIDGLEATIRIKNDPTMKHIPVIILSAKTDNLTKGVGQVAADAFLEKPLDIASLDQTIEALVTK
jgi:CheY-like chemotaxis protein